MNQTGESAVIVIDLQKCFLPNGSLPTSNSKNTNGDNLVQNTTEFIKKVNPKHLFISLDWHPEGHVSFITDELRKKGKRAIVNTPKKTNTENDPTSIVLKKYEDNKLIRRIWSDGNDHTKQTLWPPHCIQNSEDSKVELNFAENIKTLSKTINIKYVLKGFEKGVDSYSVVADAIARLTPIVYDGSYDDLYNPEVIKDFEPTKNINFLSILKKSTITNVYLTGIARNVCVFWSAMDLLQFWILPAYFGIDGATKKTIKLFFVYDLTRPVVAESFEAGLDITKDKITENVKTLIENYKNKHNITDLETPESILPKIFEVNNSGELITSIQSVHLGGSRKHKNYKYNKSRKTRKNKLNKSRKTRKHKSKKY